LEENLFLQGGKLHIKAILKGGNPAYTSGKITSFGKQEFEFGRIDVRAKLPEGQGIWPAIWMLGTNINSVGWPVSGEIDIMEAVGHEPDIVHGTAHYDAGGWQFQGNGFTNRQGETFGDRFHIYTILWQEDRIQWLVDYQKFHQIDRSQIGGTYPFNNPFYFILNLAVGGNWPGNPNGTTNFPQTMDVDYIRVFR